ncbi:hypothetical protein Leryth_015392 [Lithospermum erythrorhizon]|nr:hypothetical protein Leryth_015392 [Lithospermum erythrorhizon]
MNVPGIISDFDPSDRSNSIGGEMDTRSDGVSLKTAKKIILVANQLPVKGSRDEETKKWLFEWDHDALVLQLRDGFLSDVEVFYVGCLKVDILDPLEQDEVGQLLLDKFKCVPTFLSLDLINKYYHGFCKHYLWPLFHYMLPLTTNNSVRFDKSMWQGYVQANKIFTDKVMEVINPDEDYVWVHDYHLMNAELDVSIKRGYIGLDYYGRTVSIKILPVGIHMGQLQDVMSLPQTAKKVQSLKKLYEGKTVILGVDDMDVFKEVIIVSEFIGCSPSLSGAIRVNPWNIESVASAMSMVVTMPESEKELRHEKHYNHSNSRLILLDYDGTMMPQDMVDKSPNSEVISLLNGLCSDPNNVVFIVSGRGKDSLSKWFDPCERLGLSAEHGFFTRWSRDSQWETSMLAVDMDWKKIVLPVMEHYREATDGSYIEQKESALVWHHQDSDPDFGMWQAKELLDHLESVLANEPVVVKRGQHIVEVKPQGVSKGVVVEKLMETMQSKGKPPDFVLCIGDDRSDEDMFESIASSVASHTLPASAKVFACTVGQKPSMAKYYLDDTIEVINMLQGLEVAAMPSASDPPEHESPN